MEVVIQRFVDRGGVRRRTVRSSGSSYSEIRTNVNDKVNVVIQRLVDRGGVRRRTVR